MRVLYSREEPRDFFFFLSPLLLLQRLCSVDSLQVTTPVKMRGKKQPFPNYVFVHVCVREQEGFAILICIGWAS